MADVRQECAPSCVRLALRPLRAERHPPGRTGALQGISVHPPGVLVDHHFDHQGNGLTTTNADVGGMPVPKKPTHYYAVDSAGRRSSELSRR